MNKPTIQKKTSMMLGSILLTIVLLYLTSWWFHVIPDAFSDGREFYHVPTSIVLAVATFASLVVAAFMVVTSIGGE